MALVKKDGCKAPLSQKSSSCMLIAFKKVSKLYDVPLSKVKAI